MEKTHKKKGFTLIELLAIIVVLAVIALITTPLLLNVIEESRRKPLKREMHF
jgi:prepilin-type N-terminal cleavage/methylation domain